MKYFTEINPFFEAVFYLSRRLSDERTGDRISDIKPSNDVMTDEDWSCFEKVALLEKELDEAFMPDELMKHYFAPIETRETRSQNFPLSLGLVLLSRPQALHAEFDLDGLIDFYRNATLGMVIEHFYNETLTSFFHEPAEACSDLNGFMTLLDGILVDPQNKWDLMDVATNPVKHLERLRGLIESVSGFIAQHSGAYRELIERERAGFLSEPDTMALFNSIGFDFKAEDIDRINIWPSLLPFTEISYTNSSVTGEISIYYGIFSYRLLQYRKSKNNSKMFMNMLKLLSDETRFNAMCLMRSRYSYGQELADKLNCTRNTMYYHLEKLMGSALITCKETEYRMLYTVNKRNVYEKMNILRDYLTDGWRPENADSDEENEPKQ